MSEPDPVLSPVLSRMDGIRHGFFTRAGGVSEGIYAGLNAGLGSGDERTKVVENRRRIAGWLGCSADRIASPYQVHSALAVTTDTAWTDERPQVDGVATATPGLALGIVTADCGPVLFADPAGHVIGACHAGWGGALKGVLEATIEKMEQLGAQRRRITAALGPTISQQNYEVGREFPGRFTDLDENNNRFFTPSKNAGHYMFDLPAYIVERLERAGVQASWTGECTYADAQRFYSYRRTTHASEPDYGRQLSAIMIEE